MTNLDVPSPAHLESLAVRLATGAGALARDSRVASVDAKSSPTDMVTDVDRAVEAWLRAQIAALRPDDAVLGEEGGRSAGDGAVRWVVDPIDGTVNFVLGIAQWSVSVAAEAGGVTLAGCVHNPVSGETFRASLGGGAYLGDLRLAGPRAVPVARAVVGTGFSYDSARRAGQGAVVAALLPRIADIRRFGSAALDLCSLAAGRIDAYYEIGLNPWDWAAGLLIAREAGCVASGLRGTEPGPHMTAAAAPANAPEFFALLEELDADRV